MGSVCIYKGQRLTAASAYLDNPPPNLTIVTDAAVARILFEQRTASGAQTIDGRRFYARKEVIVSGGALNTPQILMLSGVGPQEELRKHEISLIHELPMIGRNLEDHCFSCVAILMRRDEMARPDDQEQSPSPMGWFKSPSVIGSREFETLSPCLKQFLAAPTVPSFEIATVRKCRLRF